MGADNRSTKVVVAMSGGVDSSVAAALLVEQGYSVTGMMLRLWSEQGREDSNRCCTPDAMAQARRVAARLGIPFYALDVQAPFRELVVESFLQGYAAGVTPNPCLVCNRQIRWGILMQRALDLGAEYLATGHYARLQRDPQGKAHLLRGVDAHKDQSYVLSVLSQEQLAHTLLPVGGYTKSQIRELAAGLNLSVATRPDSQDLCFLAGSDYRAFLARYAPQSIRPGEIVDRSGAVLGAHDGLGFYTIGQRKGIRLARPQPLYVLEKDLAANRLIVGTLEELGTRRLVAGNANWIAGTAPGKAFDAQVMIRYRSHEAAGRVEPDADGGFSVTFAEPLRDITAGQRAVLYQGEECLGGGAILLQKGRQD